LRRLATSTILIGALAALLIVVPQWTAGKAEAKRETAFQTAIRRVIPEHLPLCPPPGPQRDAFLEQSAMTFKNSHDLWSPVCRIVRSPSHRILIMAATRGELNGCKLEGVWKPANVICVLEEPLSMLADARTPRTWARRESMDGIWMTSRPMAWQDHLVSEHREWIMLTLVLPATALLVLFGAQRTRQAFVWRAACHGPEEPDVPRHAELLLHYVLGQRCRSLPGDLSEEYALRLQNGSSRREADLWYRWQVFHSIAPVAARRVESALRRGLRLG
jgi:hypothetical protein